LVFDFQQLSLILAALALRSKMFTQAPESMLAGSVGILWALLRSGGFWVGVMMVRVDCGFWWVLVDYPKDMLWITNQKKGSGGILVESDGFYGFWWVLLVLGGY
jgi:hypothetical protein